MVVSQAFSTFLKDSQHCETPNPLNLKGQKTDLCFKEKRDKKLILFDIIERKFLLMILMKNFNFMILMLIAF